MAQDHAVSWPVEQYSPIVAVLLRMFGAVTCAVDLLSVGLPYTSRTEAVRGRSEDGWSLMTKEADCSTQVDATI